MVEIIWELPGKTAKAFRRQCAHYIVRILGGDVSLVEEIQDRAEVVDASQRDFFLGKRGTETREKDELVSRKLKLRREEVEIEKLEAETKLYVKDGEAKLEQRKIEMEQRKIEVNKSSVTFYRDLVQEMFSEDAHMKAAFKDYAMVTLGQGSVEGSLAQFAPDISTIITNMGFRGQRNSTLCRIGKSVAKSYREMYGTAPKKTEKYVNGSVRYVNAYMQSDVAMIQEIIKIKTIFKRFYLFLLFDFGCIQSWQFRVLNCITFSNGIDSDSVSLLVVLYRHVFWIQ